MKRKVLLLLSTLLLCCLIIPASASGSTILSPENQYGMPVKFATFSDHHGDIDIDGVFVCKDGEDYVFTVLYSNGELVNIKNNGHIAAKSSFFNPPGGNILSISWFNEFSRISSDNKKVQYRVKAQKLRECEKITIFLYDARYDNEQENISLSFSVNSIDFGRSPLLQDLIQGYIFSSEDVSGDIDEITDKWAKKAIEELRLSGVLRDNAFTSYKDGITRLRFTYLMVRLYEKLTGNEIQVNNVSYLDTEDIYALKASQAGIAAGIGGNRFGPDILLNREQMAVLMVRTLKLAGISLDYTKQNIAFRDDNDISHWARESAYTAFYNGIILGMNDTDFSPGTIATNQQALVITHRLLSKYGDLKWYEEKDKSRFYLRLDNKLYNIPFAENVIVDSAYGSNDLYFKSFEDLDMFFHLPLLESRNLSYKDTVNPNFEGTLIVNDSYMTCKVENIYHGVDKAGETTKVYFDSSYKELSPCSITYITGKGVTACTGFTQIYYYDAGQIRNRLYVIPVMEIFKELDIDYSISYDEAWNIYEIEFNAVCKNSSTSKPPCSLM